jgi:putative ABC transport system substrate-binding protein
MRRVKSILLLGGLVAAWPLAAFAQTQSDDACKQASGGLRVIGFLSSSSPDAIARSVAAFRQGLKDAGYIEGENVIVDYRWANGDYGLLPAKAKQLVECKVALIAATGGTQSAQAAKDATRTIPILFATGFDPVKTKLVPSYARPGENATGIAMHTAARVATRRELLSKLDPQPKKIALLVNPTPAFPDQKADMEKDVGGDHLLEANSENALNAKFKEAEEKGYRAIIVSADPFFGGRRAQIVDLAARHRLPAIYPWREYVDAGGLMSYGVSITNAYRQIGLYAGRVLSGARPADLPVLDPPEPPERELEGSSRFELAINLTTARTLRLTIPPELIKRANYVVGH